MSRQKKEKANYAANRVLVTLTGHRRKLLNKLAGNKESQPATEAGLIISNKLDELERAGEIVLESNLSAVGEDDEAELIASESKTRLITSLMKHKTELEPGDLEIVAHSIGVSTADLKAFIEKLCNGNGKNATASR